MNFQITKTLKDNYFACDIQFKSFGTEGVITADAEEQLIRSFGATTINRGGKYVGKYSYDAVSNQITENPEGDEISFVFNPMDYPVDEKFLISCLFYVKYIDTIEYANKQTLKTPALIAEAKCLLFEKMIKQKLQVAMDELKSNKSTFNIKTEIIVFTA